MNKIGIIIDNCIAIIALLLLGVGALIVLAGVCTLGYGIYSMAVYHVFGGLWLKHFAWLAVGFIADLSIIIGLLTLAEAIGKDKWLNNVTVK